jgi:SAM-dependent methyltransferase
MNDYEIIPYESVAAPAAHPRRILWTSIVFGGPRPDLSRARVLEIGCGDGATLLPLAAFEPAWTVCGIDSSRRAIAEAARMARQSDLGNADFRHADLASVEIEAEAWDIVIAHGVYSWIDAERRAALRRLIRRALAQGGLAYVSFNALPGWSVRGRVRDLLVRAPGRGELDQRPILDVAAALAADDPWGQLLAKELRRARESRDFYFHHEYLGPVNDAFWVGDFIDDAARAGLRWVGDAQFDLAEGRPYEQLRTALDAALPGLSRVRAEELADLIGYRQFRCAVLARDDAPAPAPSSDEELVRGEVIAGRIAPPEEPVEFGSSREQTFRGPEGMEIKVDEPLCKAALVVLARHDPDGLRFDDLIHESRRLLAAAGAREIAANAERDVGDGVIRLWRAGALQLRLCRPRPATTASQRPKVIAFTKAEAHAKQRITSPSGETEALSPLDLDIIGLLDGTRGEAELIDDFLKTRGSAAGDDAFRSSAPAYVREVVSKLAQWGVLEETAIPCRRQPSVSPG